MSREFPRDLKLADALVNIESLLVVSEFFALDEFGDNVRFKVLMSRYGAG